LSGRRPDRPQRMRESLGGHRSCRAQQGFSEILHLPVLLGLRSASWKTTAVPPQYCAARVTPDRATFLFPATPATEWPVNQPITDRFQSTVEYAWAVNWPTRADSGLDYRELGLIRRRDSVPEPARLTLAQLLRRGSKEVIHERSREVGDGGVIAFTDETALAVFAENQRVVFALNGSDAVRRYTHRHPDTATFEFSRFSEPEITCRAVLRYVGSP
jgi:hypothetical protein